MGGVTRLNSNATDVTKAIKHIEKQVTNSPHAVVLVWADWCPYCVTLRPAWDATMASMATNTKPHNKTEFAEIESQHLDKIKQMSKPLYDRIMASGRMSFPTIFMFENGKPTIYDKPRDHDTMTKTFVQFASSPKPLSQAKLNANVKKHASPKPKTAVAKPAKKTPPKPKNPMITLKGAMSMALKEPAKPRQKR